MEFFPRAKCHAGIKVIKTVTWANIIRANKHLTKFYHANIVLNVSLGNVFVQSVPEYI